ncbi:tyrosine-type recombinase/integrase (plasmid) [Rhodococcus aetherivorans]|uniref:Tyrosine-type recombinase/integrase n=1 Tax=Rhodococcus aetherivorans TaxID=191292 RepID=A0AA46SGU9_9NOCA|nr:tyrosine-type recombinase/integrase [Rhodococcus aetherivorans]MDV6296460.1 tyrosine-type recombinase/integrase [Rhodococcus aetherivorans]UYF97161.1 tyrosine-type recombinase/integrase [Rhodococcus aetherivorans]
MSRDLPLLFEEFLLYRSSAKLSPHTVKAYRQDFTAIAARLATTTGTTADQLVSDVIDKTRMRAVFADFAADHSAASIRRCWSTWNNLCDYLFTSDIIEANPMAAVLRPKAEKTVPKSFDQDAVQRLLSTLTETDEQNSHAWQERDLAIVFTALLTGCRLSELVVMNVGDLRDVDDTGRTKALTVRGKGNKERVLTAEAGLVDVLTDYLESRLQRFPGSGEARSSPTDSPWRRLRAKDALFVGADGERITGPTIQYRVERAYRRAGINGQRAKGALVHQLRHTFATSLADQNVSVYTLMRLLGHEAMTTTQRYTKGAGKETRSASALNPAYRMLEPKAAPTEG